LRVVEVSEGKLVFIAGQVAQGRDGNLVGRDDFRPQVQQVFENLRAAVEAAGGDFKSVANLNYYCAESVDPAQITAARNPRQVCKHSESADQHICSGEAVGSAGMADRSGSCGNCKEVKKPPALRRCRSLWPSNPGRRP